MAVTWTKVGTGRYEGRVANVVVAEITHTIGTSGKWTLKPHGWFPIRLNGEPFSSLDDFASLSGVKGFVEARLPRADWISPV